MPDALTPSLSYEEKINRLRLFRTAYVGPVSFCELIDEFGSATQVLEGFDDILGQAGLRTKQNRSIKPVSRARVEKEIAALNAYGATFLVLGDAAYPALLSHTSDAPPVLCALGDQAVLDRPCLTIVGSREPSILGKRFAADVAKTAHNHGYNVVSGMAKGIDTVAHEATSPSHTIAVLAGGVDHIYPASNEGLYHRIRREGLIVAEQPIGTVAQARHFPRRNRIIAGLSSLTLVVEATNRSGTLITAQYAVDQGREVAAVPGSPYDARSMGCNRLIREGAHLVESPDEIMALLAKQVESVMTLPARVVGRVATAQEAPELPHSTDSGGHELREREIRFRASMARMSALNRPAAATPNMSQALATSAETRTTPAEQQKMLDTIAYLQQCLQSRDNLSFSRICAQTSIEPQWLRMAMARLELAGMAVWVDPTRIAASR